MRQTTQRCNYRETFPGRVRQAMATARGGRWDEAAPAAVGEFAAAWHLGEAACSR